MRCLSIITLFIIQIFLAPVAVFASSSDLPPPQYDFTSGANLTPAQYKIGKYFASRFCEAKEDGLSLDSAYKIAVEASIWNRIKSGAIFDLFKADNEDEEVYNAQMMKFAFSKIQRDCPIPNVDLLSELPEE